MYLFAQACCLGWKIGNIQVSSIGLADDTCLLSDCVFKLQNLLQLTVEYCKKYHVELVPDKTKLLCFSPKGKEVCSFYWKLVSPISLDHSKITFTSEADHVGITRSVNGNLPHILARMSAHNRAVMAVLPAGLARGHRGNPAASLRVELLYGAPVLLSGVAALVLNKTETKALHHHYKLFLERLQRLHKCSPEPVVCFLGGSLPLTALLHLQQLTLLGMISRLGPSNILHRLGITILSNPSFNTSHSWFKDVQHICSQYSLAPPLAFLSNPPTQSSFKSTIKAKVMDYWERKLRAAAAGLKSLSYFKPAFYSLSRPHPVWSTAGNNPYEVEKATIQARLLSGRYRTCWLSRHWSSDPTGSCSLPHCWLNGPTPGTLPHLLLYCEDLLPARVRIASLWTKTLSEKPTLIPIVEKYFSLCQDQHLVLQFLLDCSVLPDVIKAQQVEGSWVLDTLFYLTRSFCFSVHKARLRILGKWNHK